jgi:molybdopterin-guanine dinucleotide biosynthesis protein A
MQLQPIGCGFFIMRVNNAYILAGGKSSRMGQDKLFMEVGGKPLLSHALSICSELFQRVSIVAKEKNKFSALDCNVLLDWEGAEGPMAGIVAALQDCPEDYCFITAADLPDLNATTISILVNRYQGEQYFGLKESERIQPLCGIYARSSLASLIDAAKRGRYGLHEALEQLDTKFISVNSDSWRNINRPEDIIR